MYENEYDFRIFKPAMWVAHEMRWVCDVIMCSLQTSIEKSFLYSHSVPETSKQETQRAGDGRDGCFTRMDEKWNSSETTQIRTRLELRSLLHDPAALALPLNHALLASLV